MTSSYRLEALHTVTDRSLKLVPTGTVLSEVQADFLMRRHLFSLGLRVERIKDMFLDQNHRLVGRIAVEFIPSLEDIDLSTYGA